MEREQVVRRIEPDLQLEVVPVSPLRKSKELPEFVIFQEIPVTPSTRKKQVTSS